MSNDQSPPVRKVTPYKPGKRTSTVRKLNTDFAGTALEQALMMQALTEQETPLESDLADPKRSSISNRSIELDNLVVKQPSRGDQVDKRPSRITTKFEYNQTDDQSSQSETKLLINQLASYKSPNILDDEIMPALIPSEQVVLRRLFRLSYGFNRKVTHPVSYSKLAEKCHLGLTALKEAIKSLQMKNLIRVIGENKYNPAGGNQYEITIDLVLSKLDSNQPDKMNANNLAAKRPSRISTKSLNGPINHDDDHDDLKDHDHHQTRARTEKPDDDFSTSDPHQKETIKVYQEITRNKWKKPDTTAYQKIKDISLEKIELAIRLASQRASSRPNSLNYFVKEILNLANPSEQSKAQQKKALEKIVQQVRGVHVGEANYSFSDFVEDVKRACAREGVAFHNDLFNEILERR